MYRPNCKNEISENQKFCSNYGYKCPCCGFDIKSKMVRKCPHCGEWLQVTHFGFGSLFLVLSLLVCIFLAASGGSLGVLSGGLLGLVGLLYFIPSLIAEMREHDSQFAIFMVNLFFGWTFLGWFICLIWAFGGRSK